MLCASFIVFSDSPIPLAVPLAAAATGIRAVAAAVGTAMGTAVALPFPYRSLQRGWYNLISEQMIARRNFVSAKRRG